MQNQTYGMFTDKGNYMVGRIVDAANEMLVLDGDELNAWRFAYRELQKLATSEEFGEATDTEVREQVYAAIIVGTSDVPFYI